MATQSYLELCIIRELNKGKGCSPMTLMKKKQAIQIGICFPVSKYQDNITSYMQRKKFRWLNLLPQLSWLQVFKRSDNWDGNLNYHSPSDHEQKEWRFQGWGQDCDQCLCQRFKRNAYFVERFLLDYTHMPTKKFNWKV